MSTSLRLIFLYDTREQPQCNGPLGLCTSLIHTVDFLFMCVWTKVMHGVEGM